MSKQRLTLAMAQLSRLMLVAVITICALPMWSQTTMATLGGTVTDETNAVIPNVKISIYNAGTASRRQTTTNKNGHFILLQLEPGQYSLIAQQDGFAPVEVRDIILNVNDRRELLIKLKVGHASESVTVSGTSVGVETSAAPSVVVDRKLAENLPLNGRSFQALVALTPGVVYSTTTSGGQFSFNGQRDTANIFTVDGVGANTGITGVSKAIPTGGTMPAFNAFGGTNNLVSVDALQEFKIQTSTYAAEFGRGPGGQVQMLTRSGTNRLTGSVSEYFRNDALDAKNWFSKGVKTPMRQNFFGAVLGGPIVKNRTFFFASYEGLRLRRPTSESSPVPSLGLRAQAPPEMQPFLNAYPLPDPESVEAMATRTATYSAVYSNPSSLNSGAIRLDHTFGKVSLFGRYNYALSDSAVRKLSYLNPTEVNTTTITVGATVAFNPSLVNELRANYTKNEANGFYKLMNYGGATPPGDSVLFPAESADKDKSLTSWYVSTAPMLYHGRTMQTSQRQFNIVDNVSLLRGKHLLKFGADYRYLLPTPGPITSEMSLYFNTPASVLTRTADTIYKFRKDSAPILVQNLSAYSQDTWRATSRLTIDVGLRWELNPPPSGRHGKELYTLTGLDDYSTLRLAPAGTPMYPTVYTAFAPRFGAAYQLSSAGGRETVIRGGYGIYYAMGSGTATEAAFYFPYNYKQTLTKKLIPLDAALLAPPVPPSLDPPYTSQTFTVFDPNFTLPRTHQWTLTLEQAFGNNQKLSMSYVANAGRRLIRREVLVAPNANFKTGTNIYVSRNSKESSDSSDYNSLQIQFQRRVSVGLEVLANYTWSHAIDTNAEDDFVNWRADKIDPKTDRADSIMDRRHLLNAAVSYDLPSPSWTIIRPILKGWAVNGMFKYQSAMPLNITVSRDLGFGFGSFRPDVIPGVPLYINDPTVPHGWRINAAAFDIPKDARQGTAPRNMARGFGATQFDVALHRQFSLTDRMKLQFRAEMFNALNHPNFSNVLTILGTYSGGVLYPNSTFGYAKSMLGTTLGTQGLNSMYQVGGPRSVQLALKVTF